MKQEMMGGGQWHQLDHMQIICILFQIDIHPCQHLISQFFTGRTLSMTPNQQCQSTEGLNDQEENNCSHYFHNDR